MGSIQTGWTTSIFYAESYAIEIDLVGKLISITGRLTQTSVELKLSFITPFDNKDMRS